MQFNMGEATVSKKEIQNRKKFLEWFKKTNPGAYAEVMRKAGVSTMNAAGDPVAEPSIWDKIVAGAEKIIPMVVQAKAQKQIFNAQLDRAKQGLPPLQTSEIAPTIRVQTDVGQQTRTAFTDTLKQLALPVGIGLAGLLFMLKKK